MSTVPSHSWTVQEAINRAENALVRQSFEEARCWMLYATTVGGFEAQATSEAQRGEFVESLREPGVDAVLLLAELADYTGPGSMLPPVDDWIARARQLVPTGAQS